MTKIDIVSGFLGAGKTTLIKKMLSEAYQGEKLVLIENEFGEISIDGGFLKDSGVQISEMSSGCICCSLVGDFNKALRQVHEQFAPDRILIEPSGVGKLSDVIVAVENTVRDEPDMKLNSFVTVADATKVKVYMKNFGEFYNNQIESAGTIILSRTQKLSQEKLEAAVALLREKNPTAAILTTPWDELDGKTILSAIEKVSLSDELLEKMRREHELEEAEHEHEHHHDHDEECGCGHHHEHHHDHDEECTCGHHHEHHHDHDEDHHHTHDHEDSHHTHDHHHDHEGDHHDHSHEAHHHSHELAELAAEQTIHEHTHTHDHDHDCGHDHTHDHGHTHHHHASMAGISHIIEHLNLPEEVKADVVAVYQLIAEAESHVHGKTVEEIHFHEVGTADAIADIAGVCLLMHMIVPQKVIASPIHVGSGNVHCAHGILPVPAPATAFILQGLPIYSGVIKGELCTPTGAALLKHFVTEFKEMPVMRTAAIGYGMGKKDFERANCMRVLLGETEENGSEVTELSCNLDDMTPEALGFVQEILFAAGALEVYTIPIGMKKSRPGILLTCMCRCNDKEKMVSLLFKHTTTLGIRESISKRYTLTRTMKEHETPYGVVREKVSEGYGVVRGKLEYEDLAKIAKEHGMSLEDVKKLIGK